jgi:hypothetical protein
MNYFPNTIIIYFFSKPTIVTLKYEIVNNTIIVLYQIIFTHDLTNYILQLHKNKENLGLFSLFHSQH